MSTLTRRHRRGGTALLILTLLAQLVAGVIPAAVGAADDTATIVTGPWAVDGETAVLTKDGSGGLVQLDYDLNPAGDGTTSWFMNSVAAGTGQIQLDWRYTGFHAWFDVDVDLEVFVIGAESSDFSEVLVDAHADDNASGEPTGGFDYEGTVTLNVEAGDTIGFELSGRNYDTTNILRGTLQVGFNVLQNGSFEQPDVPNAGVVVYAQGAATIPGWSVGPGDGLEIGGTVDISNNGFVNCVATFGWFRKCRAQ